MRKINLIAFIIFVNTSVLSAFSETVLTKNIQQFENIHGKTAVILYQPASGKIAYVYNPALSYERSYPPGSVSKIFSSLIFLENQQAFDFLPEKKIFCNGKYYIPSGISVTTNDMNSLNIRTEPSGKKFLKCSGKHGAVDLHSAIIKSCNVYFLIHAEKNPRLFYSLLNEKWHLDKSTDARLKNNREYIPSAKPETEHLKLLTSAIGEGGMLRISPLKLAQTTGAFFERTQFLSPYEENNFSPAMSRPFTVAADDYRRIYAALGENHSTGTLRKLAFPSGIRILGSKTGTGTHFQKKYSTHGWNTIYFEKKGIHYILISFVYNGTGSGAAKILSEVVLKSL